jgi:hypothetical protein
VQQTQPQQVAFVGKERSNGLLEGSLDRVAVVLLDRRELRIGL